MELLERRFSLASPVPQRVAAIGDVHGRLELFEEALDAIEDPENTVLVLLGDYVDRGPDSLGCLRLLNALITGDRFKQVIALPGNHEGLLRDGLGPSMKARLLWLKNGGQEFSDQVDGDLDAIRALIPQQILDRLTGRLPCFHQEGPLLFVHAGLHPELSAEHFLNQAYETPQYPTLGDLHWAWVRAPFLFHEGPFLGPEGDEVIVVHGHTSAQPTHENEAAMAWALPEDKNRICLDLSQASRMPLLQVQGHEAKVTLFGKEPYLGLWL